MPSVGNPGRRPSIAWLIATFCGVGLIPFASGTFATLAAVPVYLAGELTVGPPAILALLIFFTVAGVAAAGVMQTRLGYHDPSEVVVDEVAGFLLTMLYVPASPWTLAAGFLLFRAFDVIKPWPASAAEKLPGGWGIMADDLVCGLMANALIQVGLYLWR